ncbi:ribonuclease E/G [Amorphus orientalis]|uniref:Ribonuclease E n=1 Tax=Amorphus orientalis TaxID=649198 RepID=A0AAE3VS17_9HYPH|nr:ribonuclease E/G [Amorphus orientalis]MDQ0317709.1 ribonuclease E [Amorphus orientalis]
MANKMLVDAAHPEETRVVVVRGNRVEDFDFEAAARKPLRGNIYLAKVTRVEPSLQAAFVDYGGNRHGFLAFNEIHPDYYQIPHADRQALLDAEAEDAAERSRSEDSPKKSSRNGDSDAANDSDASSEAGENGDNGDDDSVESVGADDALDEVLERRSRPARKTYKIQEVIKRRQILLVQVVKEERGTKGAALTTYLSLAGRYSVLMPNTARGGGISRKITTPQDRKRLKEIVSDLDVPEGMGVILRTAGASRTKAEIRRDFEYLIRMWETVRDLTLKSVAPTLVYEEGSLIKRSIRDLYNKDIDEILVHGEPAYKEAKDFMRMLMPSHAKNVKPYREITPIFTRFGVEAQLDAMFSPQVTLPSGGYIVLNPTEALVSIDVNSGRATREHNIEATALQTNMEAAEEIARQLRLRDLAGLIVIDFIDMEEKRNNRSVERKVKDCLKVDRARIQVGRISHFGLLEMSRQRIRQGVVESSTTLCPHCHGTGSVRSTDSVALYVLRALEDHLLKSANHHLTVRTPTEVALYILNQKRQHLAELEQRFGLTVAIMADTELGTKHLEIDTREPVIRAEGEEPPQAVIEPDTTTPDEPEAASASQESSDNGDGNQRRRKRRRRGRRSGSGEGDGDGGQREQAAESTESESASAEASGEETEAQSSGDDEQTGDQGEDDRPRRRRGRRGGRRNRRDRAETTAAEGADGTGEDGTADAAETSGETAQPASEPAPDAAPETAKADEPAEAPADAGSTADEPAVAGGTTETAEPEKTEQASEEAKPAEAENAAPPEAPERAPSLAGPDGEPAGKPDDGAEAEPEAASETDEDSRLHSIHASPDTDSSAETESESDSGKPSRRGWWQRRSFF